jgi:cytochrome c biogenesis factor
MHAARQQRGEIGFAAINRIHRPVALASMLLLLAAVLLGWRRQDFADLGLLAGAAAAAILANAFVCGVLSNPHDRYGARLVWIAPLVLALLLCRHYTRSRPANSGQSPIRGPVAAGAGSPGRRPVKE